MIDWTAHVYYDESSPSGLRWKVVKGLSRVVEPGDVVGTRDKRGYWSFVLSANGTKKRRYCHRVIWMMFNGEITPDIEVDHEDGNRQNNKIGNLRLADRKLNGRNAGQNPRNVTGVAGVSLIQPTRGYYYYAATWVDLEGKQLTLGRFKDFFEACCARKSAEIKYYGKVANV